MKQTKGVQNKRVSDYGGERMEKRLVCPHCEKPIYINVTLGNAAKKDVPLVEAIKGAISKWAENVDITQKNGTVVVTPKGYLGTEMWHLINSSLSQFETKWVSAGKESRWVIKRG